MTAGAQGGLSFSAFFECTYPAMLARAIVLSGHRENAEDAVQEAYTEALRRWDRLARYDSAEAWVYRVMAQRLWRSQRTWARLADLAGDMPVHGGPEQAAEVRDVLEHLACLPPQQRAALVMHTLGGLSQQEVADELGVKRGTVAASIFGARRRLSEALGIVSRQPAHGHTDVLVPTAGRDGHVLAGWAEDPLAAALKAVQANIRAAIEADPEAVAAALASIQAQAAAAPQRADGRRPGTLGQARGLWAAGRGGA